MGQLIRSDSPSRALAGNADGRNGSTGGVLGVAAGVAAMIVWFAIVFPGRCPGGLWNLIAYYMRWRVRAAAHVALLRDEYPPFGDGPYPAGVELAPDEPERDLWRRRTAVDDARGSVRAAAARRVSDVLAGLSAELAASPPA